MEPSLSKTTTIDKDLLKRVQELGTFDPNAMDFLEWQNKFEYLIDYFLVPSENVSEFLLGMLEPSVVEIIEIKTAPAESLTVSYDDLIVILEEMFSSIRGIDAAKYRLYKRFQYNDEIIAHYANTLIGIADKCKLGNERDFILKNQFIRGLLNDNIKNILMEGIPVLKFDQSVGLALYYEDPKTKGCT